MQYSETLRFTIFELLTLFGRTIWGTDKLENENQEILR